MHKGKSALKHNQGVWAPVVNQASSQTFIKPSDLQINLETKSKPGG